MEPQSGLNFELVLGQPIPEVGDVNFELTLAPPMVDDQPAPPVVGGQQAPVVADGFPERGELICELRKEEHLRRPAPEKVERIVSMLEEMSGGVGAQIGQEHWQSQ